jgi:site-specific DNA-methyltransferase (adenine-specific)
MKHRSDVYNLDCVEGMKAFPNKYFDLALVDPPYGINAESGYGQSNNKNIHNKGKVWDKQTPTAEYFNELKRVSKNQIVFGANYFIENLGSTRCFICWDKQQQGRNFADCEFAWTSFDRVAKLITVRYLEPHECNIYNTIKRIHPTQKPIKLYEWIIKEFAKEGDLILDTHMGSQSSRIAAYDMGFDYVGFELDEDYFQQGNKRFENFISQQKLF